MIYPEVQKLTKTELALLVEQYKKNNFINSEISVKLGVKRGLRNPDGSGVLAGLTNICDVVGYDRAKDGKLIPIDGKLIYRGIDIEDIVEEASKSDRFFFEEVVFLLLFGNLPTKKHLKRFHEILEGHRDLPNAFAETQILAAPSPNIMNKMARSVLAMYSYDEKAEDTSLENIIKQSINLIAGLPTMMVYAYQTKKHAYDRESLFYHYPKKSLYTAEHILASYRPDQKYTKEEAKLLDICLIVHADHGGGNNSTFTTRVLSSSGTDTYSSIAGSILSLKGPKHGGASLKVIHMLEDIVKNVNDINNDKEMEAYLRKILNREVGDRQGLIYGMGHAVYTKSDPRALILKKCAKNLAYKKGVDKEYEAACQVEKLAPYLICEEKGHRDNINVCANVDLYSGIVYKILGISEDIFTPLFVIARIGGWCAHRMEEVASESANRIIRPAYKYVGSSIREYTSLEKR